jgi:protocatechuate 3,4-dioxygenase alpha subunit
MTASQTVGPFLHIGLAPHTEMAGNEVSGEHITIAGRIVDGNGAVVPDAVVEIWQANAHGKYAHPDDPNALPLVDGFAGFGRCPTDVQGGFRFQTIKPGSVPNADGSRQAPHVVVMIFMRGLLKHLVTRIYFADEGANPDDAVLQQVPPARRATLMAHKRDGSYHWDIVLQGAGETVFFDI